MAIAWFERRLQTHPQQCRLCITAVMCGGIVAAVWVVTGDGGAVQAALTALVSE